MKLFQREFRNQYLATFLAQSTALIFGVVIGWMGPNLPLLQSDQTPLKNKLTLEESAWAGSIMMLGSLSVFLFGWLSERFGRKITIVLISIPQTISWIYMLKATDASDVLISRFLAGLAAGGVYTCVPIYVAEISHSSIRGQLGSAFAVICNIGILLEFVMAKYLDFYTISKIVIAVSILTTIAFSFVPESPQFLISKSRIEDAEKSYRFFRGFKKSEIIPVECSIEFNNMRTSISKTTTGDSKIRHLIRHLLKPKSLKATLIAVMVSNFPLFSGCFIIILFTHTIFTSAGSIFTADNSSIFVAFIQIIGSCITIYLVDRAGRKILIVSTAFGTAICLAAFGGFSFMKSNGFDVAGLEWIPLIVVSLQILFSSSGLIPVAAVVLTEVLDQKIRGIVVAFCTILSSIFAFTLMLLYPYMEIYIGLHGTMWVFTATCVISGLFTLFYIPETKGITLEDVAENITKKPPVVNQ